MTTNTSLLSAPASGGGLRGAIHAEWTKLWSVRSSWWSTTAVAVLLLGYTASSAISVRVNNDQPRPADAPHAGSGSAPLIVTEGVFYLAQFVVAAWAAMSVAGEYGNGSIRSTLQWVPVRTRALVAKCAVLAPVLFVLGLVLSAASIAVAVPLLGDARATIAFGEHLRAVVAIGAYWALLGVLSAGIAIALRSVAGSVTSIFVLLVMVPALFAAVGLVPVLHYLPGVAGLDLMAGHGNENMLTGLPVPHTDLVSLAILLVWVAGAFLMGNAVLRKRDA